MNHATLIVLALGLPAAPRQDPAPAAPAARTPAEWFDAAAPLRARPLTTRFRVETRSGATRIGADAVLHFQDSRRFRLEIQVGIEGEDLPEGARRIEMRQLMVGDGATLWQEFASPADGLRVLRSAFAQGKAQGAPGFGLDLAPGFDPIGVLLELRGAADWRLDDAESADGARLVRLRGVLRPAERPAFAEPGSAGPREVLVVLDRATALPLQVLVGPEAAPRMRMQLLEPRLPERIDPELLRYSPPEGVEVVDTAGLFGVRPAGSDGDAGGG